MDSYIADIYKTLNILCVEDDENVLQIYKDLFSLIFKKVYFATNGIEGLACFNEKNIDIILTDYMMPQCNGLEMTKEIRKIDSSIPIVLVTAIENINMLREAIDLNITSFLKKPFTSTSLFSTFNLAVKSVIVDRSIFKEQTEKLLYSSYQEKLTFDKEKTITKNDLQNKKKLLYFECEVLYQPQDILSGDSYLIKEIKEEKEYLLFLVDGMGKGISASVTAMLCSAFINYYVESLKKNKYRFELEKLLEELHAYITPNLLENEVISISLLYFNKPEDSLKYAIFSMPPVLYTYKESQEVHKIKSNNTPLAAYSTNFNIDSIHISAIDKILLYSDGLNESSVKSTGELYTHSLKEDFLKAKSLKEFKKMYSEKLLIQEDDITYIFMKKCKDKGEYE